MEQQLNLKRGRLLSIIIINYNLTQEIENCLNSLFDTLKNVDEIEYEILIIDNNSPDKKLKEIEKKFPQRNISFYYLDENIGFGRGCNYGSLLAKGNFLCFLNPDTIISENLFTPFVSLLDKENSIGIIGPRQLTKPPFFDFSAGFYPNLFYEFFHVLGIGVFLEGMITHFYTKFFKKDFLKVGWILGAAIFIRKEVFDSVKGFDIDYFMFSEEVDLCRRVSKSGFKIIYSPKYNIQHIGSVSGKKNYTLYTIRTYSSKNLYFSKHYSGLNKFFLKGMLRLSCLTQLIIWFILIPLNANKSIQKIKAFIYLLRNNVRYTHV